MNSFFRKSRNRSSLVCPPKRNRKFALSTGFGCLSDETCVDSDFFRLSYKQISNVCREDAECVCLSFHISKVCLYDQKSEACPSNGHRKFASQKDFVCLSNAKCLDSHFSSLPFERIPKMRRPNAKCGHSSDRHRKFALQADIESLPSRTDSVSHSSA